MAKRNKWISLLLAAVMMLVLLVITSGCGKEEQPAEEETAVSKVDVDDAKEVGEGEHHFYLIACDEDGEETTFSIYTDKETVGDALVDLDLIEVDEREYGMYVEEVNGVEVNYTQEGQYWAFIINDELAPTSVDSTEIEEDAVYMFRIEQAW